MNPLHSGIDGRLRRLVRERLRPALLADARPLAVESWSAPGEPVPVAEALTALYTPTEPGTAWGAPWSTTWLRLTGVIPREWSADFADIDLIIDLGFTGEGPGFQAEGLAIAPDGSPLKGISPFNRHVPLALLLPTVRVEQREAWLAGERDLQVVFYVEAAANPNLDPNFTFAPSPLGDSETLPTEPLYRLGRMEVVRRPAAVWHLLHDILVLEEIAAEPGTSPSRRNGILFALQDMLDAVDPANVVQTAAAGRERLAAMLDSPAISSAHRVIAGGHAHIDSAWLWPYRETRRKLPRTYATALALMDEYPDYVFVTSSAQHLAWVKASSPELFARIAQRVAEGRFVPVGGMWVESDTNLPSGESLVRQFLEGQTFFAEEFGIVCEEVWLPDSFGYSGALPQIMRGAGARWFLTQKMSWNDTNRMPHHTFWWEGIDGSRILTHFPPVDNYNCDLTARQLALAERQQAESDRDTISYAPSGWGDGGGGPTREHAERAHRLSDLEGLPRVSWGTPREFFEAVEAELIDAPVWTGEMYLELHRGVSTTQARAKRGNRECERLLREVELWCATATVRTGCAYPLVEIRDCWQTVLLHQFHDSLPGSAIAWVYADMARDHARVAEVARELIAAAMVALSGGSAPVSLILNPGPLALRGVPALGGVAADQLAPRDACTIESAADGTFILDDGHSRAVVDARGLLVSLVDNATGRDTVSAGDPGNLPELHRDLPNRWDAWDIDEHHRRSVVRCADGATVRPEGDGVIIDRLLSDRSRMRQELTLVGGALRILTEVEWHEHEVMLKLALPFAIRAEATTAETHFGHHRRPTHTNTGWERAKYEAATQRWVHLAEGEFGVAVANDASHGYDVQLTRHDDGTTTTRLGVSLVRGARFPDPEADQGRHEFTLTVRPGADIPAAIADGYALNVPLREASGPSELAPLIELSDQGILIEAVKLAHDGSGDVVVRLYECTGTRRATDVRLGFPADWIERTDLLERPLPGAEDAVTASAFRITLRPFEIATFRIRRA